MTGGGLDPLIEARLIRLQLPPEDADLTFHAVTLTEDGMTCPCTRWVGWADVHRRIELRRSDPVGAEYAQHLAQIAATPIFVTAADDFAFFLAVGGAALIERSLAETGLPDLAEPFTAFVFGRSGFVGESVLDDGAQKRAPSAKKRMSILKRDGFRCRICGRSADDHVDVELEVHHIRPWGEGGLTDRSNLVTLCRTCHRGLDPHFERSLLSLVEHRDAVAHLGNFERDLLRYRRRDAWGHRAPVD